MRVVTKEGGHFAITEHGEEFRKAVITAKPALVVVDPLALMHDLDENLNADMTYFIEYFKIIAVETDCAVVMMHHTTKDVKTKSAAANMYASRGSTALPALARSVWQLGEEEESDSIFLKCVKSNHSSRGANLNIRRVSITLGNGDAVGLLEAVTPAQMAKTSRGR